MTADAIHTNTETIQQWVDAGAYYVLIVKGNQKTVLRHMRDTF